MPAPATMTPTESDIALAREWAESQRFPVTVRHITDYPNRWRIECDVLPYWLADMFDRWYPTELYAWAALAASLKPVIASVRPVIEAEALRRAAGVAGACADERRHATEDKYRHTPESAEAHQWLRAKESEALRIKDRILALIPAKGADRDAD